MQEALGISMQNQEQQAHDSISYYFDEERPDDTAPADTMAVVARDVDEETLRKLKEDPELQYGVESTVAESLWQRFWRWVGDWIESILRAATTTNLGRLFAYFFLLAALIVAVLMILKVNAYRMLFGAGASAVPHSTFDENIHEMDFERLIRDAVSQQDFRLAVRLVFLHALKMLSDNHHIHWVQGKTNHDYLAELSAGDIKNGFSELNFFFEYAWYGHFDITDGVYARVKGTFDEWRQKLS